MSDPKIGVPPTPANITVTGNAAVNINPDYAEDIGNDLANLAGVSLTPAGRKKIYSLATKVNTIAIPVYGLGVSTALFVGGSAGVAIGVCTGVLAVVNNVLGAFIAKLAKDNVSV